MINKLKKGFGSALRCDARYWHDGSRSYKRGRQSVVRRPEPVASGGDTSTCLLGFWELRLSSQVASVRHGHAWSKMFSSAVRALIDRWKFWALTRQACWNIANAYLPMRANTELWLQMLVRYGAIVCLSLSVLVRKSKISICLSTLGRK